MDAIVQPPKPPEGHKWKEVRHDDTVCSGYTCIVGAQL